MMLLFALGSNDKKIYRQKVYIGDDTMHTMKPFVQPGELLWLQLQALDISFREFTLKS